MLLVVGLGNPGSDYARNRHNVGFMAVDEIVHRYRFSRFRTKFHGKLAEGEVAGRKVMVFKPMTYMNRSGDAVLGAVRFFKVAPENVIVFHDELDLACGKIRVKRGGGHAGHNGLRSIHSRIGNKYGRVRIGIGHPGTKERVVGHVLKDFSKSESDWVRKMMDAIGEAFPLLADGDDSGFMTKVALIMNPPVHNKREEPAGETAADNVNTNEKN
ncbi:MAG: aminoacyl-tRNA hydrolase [Rhodospirillales bacterium]|nr:aminoacyl-tRNA hydrolase [Rhodospirillales bacterium]